MSALPDLLARAAEVPPAFGVGVVAKGTLLLLAAGAASLLLHRASAAARHLAWALAVAGLLVLPPLSLAVPGWDVPLPGLRTAPEPVLLPPVLAVAPREGPATPEPAADLRIPPPTREMAAPAAASAPASAAPDRAAMAPPTPSAASPRLGWAWVLLAWAAGCLAVLGRMGLGQLGVRRIARRAEPVCDLRWTVLLTELAAELGVERPVRLLRSPRAAMPMTWGVLRPVILLPAGAREWPESRRRVVLLHELAHVARHDCLTQVLAGVACALYWFHPLAWHAARRLRAERELACDDRVLEVGTPAPEYAGHLLDVARSFRSGRLVGAAAIAMARPSQLEGRLLAVLDGVRARRAPSRRAHLLAAAAALLLLLPLAALRAGARAEAALPPAAESGARSGAEAAPAPRQAAAQDAGFERRLPARSGETLYLDLRHDIDARVEGWDREEVWVRLDPATPERRDTRLEVDEVRGGVRIAARRAGGAARRDTQKLEVRVPHRFNVEILSEGGGVQLSSLEGRFTGRTEGGGLHLQHLRGEARLSTEGGGAMISGSSLQGELVTGGAGVLLQGSAGGLDIRTGGAAIVRSRIGEGGDFTLLGPGSADDPGPELDVDCAGSECNLTLLQDGTQAGRGFAYVVGDDSGSRRQSVEQLARNAPPAAAVAALARIAFEDRDVEVQREAAESLGDLPGDHGTAELLRIARTHPAAEVRAKAAEALEAKGSDQAIAALREMIERDRDAGVQVEAVESIAGVYARDDAGRRISRRQVREMLDRVSRRHPSAKVRAKAAEELAELEEKGEEVALGEARQGRQTGLAAQADPTSERIPVPAATSSRFAARFSDAALGSAADAGAIRRFRDLLAHRKQHPGDLVRERAEWALTRVTDGRVVEPLVASLGSADWRVRANAAWALGVAGDRRGAAPLAAALGDPAWRVRANAASSLAALPDARAVEPLIRALGDAEWQVRAAAVVALGNSDDRRAIPALKAVLRDGHMAVRSAVGPALARLKEKDRTPSE